MAQPAMTERILNVDMNLTREIMEDREGDITDDDLNEFTYMVAYEYDSAAPLSPRIGLCLQLQDLSLKCCSRIPPEIGNCQCLKSLSLYNCEDVIELPQGIVLEGLKTVCLFCGTWNEDNVVTMLTWLASCCPNLTAISFARHTRVTARIFMEGLLQTEIFRDKFKDQLFCLNFSECNLTEEDASYVIFNIVQPIFTKLSGLSLTQNDIQSIQSLGNSAINLTKTGNGPITSNLRCLYIEENPVFENLKSPETTDHNVAVCLVKSFPTLCEFSDREENLQVSSIINYQAMINRSELRYLLEDGNNGDGDGTRLSIWPYVIHRVYESTDKDPNSIYSLLREGPVIKDR
jgi:hypothetical protein